MGSYLSSYLGRYLSTVMAKLWPPSEVRWYPRPRPTYCPRFRDQRQVTHEPRKRCVRTGPLPTTPPCGVHARDRTAVVPEACRRFPSTPPPESFMGLHFSDNQKSVMKQWLWNAHNPRRIQSPVTIKIAPPEGRGSFYRCPPIQESPDPCAKETVLRGLSRCQKGKGKFDGPLWFETPDTKRTRQSPEHRPSAFKPMRRNGVIRCVVPRPGPLTRVSEERTLAPDLTTALSD